jgi:hypothetical protein
MARQMGAIPLKGTIDGLTFYKHPEDGHLAKAKTSLSRDKVLHNPSFAKFRANRLEFDEGMYAGKLLRKAISTALFLLADMRISGRMNAAFKKVVQTDPENGFGERLFTAGDVSILKGFNFNRHYPLQDVFTGNYFTGQNKINKDLYISIPSFDVAANIVLPPYASHFQFVVCRAVVDFEKGIYKSISGSSDKLSVSQPVTPAHAFTLPLEPGVEGLDILVLGVAFFAKLEDIPRNAISARKRKKLKSMTPENGMLRFSGSLKIIRVDKAS